MVFDFALILVVATAVTGTIWAADALLFARRRAQGDQAREPLLVEYSRSFFPILLIVLIVRSFLYEPFRIPSNSMVPTLLTGDFIFVSKFSYGLRLPVGNQLVLPLNEPQRGDVVVFRLPSNPSVNYIKRLVGLPGDHIEYDGRNLRVNGEQVNLEYAGEYELDHHTDMRFIETLGGVAHDVLADNASRGRSGVYDVPQGHYFMMGDNRDHSADSRCMTRDRHCPNPVGFVPAENLVGRAVRIWFSWDLFNFDEAPKWSRIGDPVR